MDDRRARRHRLLHVDDGRQDLELNLDQFQRTLGDGAAFGRHGRDAITHKPHLGIEQVGVVRRGLRPGLARGSVRDPGHILISEDGVHPFQFPGLTGVDSFDPRVRMGAGEDLAVKHAGQVNVVGEGGAAGHQLAAIHLANIVSDDAGAVVHDFTSTASTACTGFR